MIKKTLSILSIITITSSSFSAPLLGGDISFYYLNQNISGWVQTKNESRVDVKSDLGYDNKGSYGFKLAIDNPTGIFFVPNFGLEYMKVDFSGSSSLKRNITYGGTTFNNGENIKSNLKLNHYDFIFAWSFINNNKVDLRMGVSIRGIKYDTKITSPGKIGKKKEDIWVPMFYMNVKVTPASWFGLVFTEKVMSYSGNNYSDLDVEARFYPVNSVFKPFVSVGYKKEAFSLEDTKGISSALTFDQPYVGVGMSF